MIIYLMWSYHCYELLHYS